MKKQKKNEKMGKLQTKPASGVKRKSKNPRKSHQLVKKLKRPRLLFQTILKKRNCTKFT